MDTRIARWADVLTNYCMELRHDDVVEIIADAASWPLIAAAYGAAIRAGAHPFWHARSDELDAIFFAEAGAHQLDFMPPDDTTETISARLTIYGGSNQGAMSGVQPNRVARRQRTLAPLRRRYRERISRGEVRQCITLFPTPAEAQAAGLSTDEFSEFVFRACFLDVADPVVAWTSLRDRQVALVNRVERASTLRFEADGTDISFSVAGRRWVNSTARRNFPSGEVFTGPVEGTAHGVIRFSFPSRYEGRLVDGVELQFDHGQLIRATADTGEPLLHSLTQLDEGAAQIGEVAIGTNYRIDRHIGNTLYDEKIGGTVHIALGAGYAETGSTVRSALHWDLILDLRRGGRVLVDDEPIVVDGRILIGEWPHP